MKQRIQTAILAFIIFIPFVIFGGLSFTIFVYALATIGLIELLRMRKISKYSVPSIIAIALLWIILYPEPSDIIFYTKSEVIMLFVLFLLTYTVLVKNKFTFDDAGFILLSTIYVGMGFFYLLETRDWSNLDGLFNIFYVLVVIWATDIGAYFAGRTFGRKKLWPEISPNKTVEGAIGGIVLACITAVIFHIIESVAASWFIVIGVTVLISIFGQIGDLVESAFKRHYGVKDSGDLLPGHGGILDRLDSLLFVLPILHFIQFL